MQTQSRNRVIPAVTYDNVPFICNVGHPDPEITYGYYHRGEVTPFYEIYTPNSDGRRTDWNNFEHFKSASAEPSVGQTGIRLRWNMWDLPHVPQHTALDPYVGYDQYWNNQRVTPFGDAGQLDTGLPAYVVQRSDGGFIPPPDDLDGLIARALRHMLPVIKSELSLINSVIELKDFKRPLARSVATIRSGAYRSFISRVKRWKPRDSLRRLIQMMAGGYLQMQFNILPLISDISAIYSALSETERRINDLVSRSGRAQNKHFVFRWDEHPDVHDESGLGFWADYATGFQQLQSERWVVSEPTVFHAQIQYNYNYTEYQAAHAQLLATLDALGVNLNPAIIWNAIPWSFVVDWVLGVSRALNDFKVENMKPKINIRRFLWSVKRQRMISVLKGIKTDTSGLGCDRNMLPRVYQTAYRRSVGLPSASSIESSGLSSHEFSLGAALVIARRRRRKTRAI